MLPYRFHFHSWSTQQVIVAQLLCWFLMVSNSPCSSLSIILTSSYEGRWFPFSFHIWSSIPDFFISPNTTAFRCSSSLTFHTFVYFTTTARDGVHSSWSWWILLGAWFGRDTPKGSSHLWILSWCHRDYICFGFFETNYQKVKLK